MTISRKTALFISFFIVVIMFLFLYFKGNVKTGGVGEDPCDVGAPGWFGGLATTRAL
jgi:hypothetical protein